MKGIRWFFVLMIVLCGVSRAQTTAPAASPRVPAAQAPRASYPEIRIAAVVNDDMISVSDLASRIRMVMLSTSIPDTPQARQRLAAQVLRQLIDEKLQIQEAKRKNITANDAEIKKAIATIEQQNNMKPGQLDEILKANGIERSAMVQQVTASIVWAKLIRQIAADTDPVSDEEIEDTLKRLKQNENEPQSRVAEIFLAVDNPQQDAEVLALANRLIDQMKQGARFSAVAQQFSQSATAAVGGDIGWIQPDELSPPLAKAVATDAPRRAVSADPDPSRLLYFARSRPAQWPRGQRGRYDPAHRAGGLPAASATERGSPPRRARRSGGGKDGRKKLPGYAADRQGEGAAIVERGRSAGRARSPRRCAASCSASGSDSHRSRLFKKTGSA